MLDIETIERCTYLFYVEHPVGFGTLIFLLGVLVGVSLISGKDYK